VSTEPLIEQLRRVGPAVEIAAVEAFGEEPRSTGAATELIAAIRAAVGATDPTIAAEAWTRAGALHDPETLDEALAAVAPSIGVPILTGMRRRRLRDAARVALQTTTCVGTLRLVGAILGAVGESEDAAVLETVAAHPALTLHGATALANLSHWEGRAALLRLLSRVSGAERVLVIDRLLPFVREPAVRLALVRDGFTDLDDEHAREIAPAVAEALDLASWLDEPRTSDELREAARAVLAHAGRSDR
jgi:hypothetical protein